MPAVAETSRPSPAASSHVSAGEASCAQRLADLEAAATEAVTQANAARNALERHGSDAAGEIAADLIAYRDAIEAKKPGATPEADRPATERELTRAYCEAVMQRGLVLMPVGQRGAEVVVIDPKLDAEYRAATAAQVKATRAVSDFKTKHAADLEKERRRADAARIKDALAGDDGDAIREVLLPSVPQANTGVFTTRDLPRRTRGG